MEEDKERTKLNKNKIKTKYLLNLKKLTHSTVSGERGLVSGLPGGGRELVWLAGWVDGQT